ncbi:MAG: low molecular weight phosphatase family protein [Mycobacterium kyogaense]
MAAALTRQLAGDSVIVASAGTRPGDHVNALSSQALAEVGVDLSGETPKPISASMIRDADVLVVLGREARVEQVAGPRFETWDTVEPSERGIDGIERMRLIRDDIARRVRALVDDLST